MVRGRSGAAVTGVTSGQVDLGVHVPVMFSKSARQGETDTTAKLLGAAAKWLFPGLESEILNWSPRASRTDDGADLPVSTRFGRV